MAKQNDKIQAMVNDIDPATRKVIQRPLIDIVRENEGMVGVLAKVIQMYEAGVNKGYKAIKKAKTRRSGIME